MLVGAIYLSIYRVLSRGPTLWPSETPCVFNSDASSSSGCEWTYIHILACLARIRFDGLDFGLTDTNSYSIRVPDCWGG